MTDGPVTSFVNVRDACVVFPAASAPVSVAFAIRRHGGAWQRVAIDDSAPYRAFLTPARFKKREQVEGVAVARGLDGTVSSSCVCATSPTWMSLAISLLQRRKSPGRVSTPAPEYT